MQRFLFAALALCLLAVTVNGFAQEAKKDDEKAAKQDAKKDDAKKDDAAKDDKAKDDKAKEEDKAADKEKADDGPQDFKSIYTKFQSLEDELNDIAQKYGSAPQAERTALLKDYNSRVEKIRELLPKLRIAALKEYKESPNKNKDLAQTLVGLLANHNRSDEYEEGAEIASLLLENKCDVKELPYFAGIAYYCTHQFEKAKGLLQQAKDAKLIPPGSPGGQYLDDLDAVAANWKAEAAIREKEAKADDLPRVKMTTSEGDIVIELFENEAPQAVANFVNLVEDKYYDGLIFHRVLPGFMAQGGCPKGTGTGGPGYNIYCECYQENYRKHFRGSLSMAHAGRDTGGSQFFLTFRPTTHLDGRHTVFGRVLTGMDVLAKIQRRDPSRQQNIEPDKIIKAEVTRKRDHAYEPTKVK